MIILVMLPAHRPWDIDLTDKMFRIIIFIGMANTIDWGRFRMPLTFDLQKPLCIYIYSHELLWASYVISACPYTAPGGFSYDYPIILILNWQNIIDTVLNNICTKLKCPIYTIVEAIRPTKPKKAGSHMVLDFFGC